MKLILFLVYLNCIALAAVTVNADSGRVSLLRYDLGEIGGWIMVTVESYHEAGNWLLDTGSNHNLVSKEYVKYQGLKTGSSVKAVTALGQLQAPQVMLPPLKIGSLKKKKKKALVVDLNSVVGAVGKDLDGILGVPFFDEFELTIDMRKQELEIQESSNANCPANMTTVMLEEHQGLPVINVVVNSGSAESLLLDTGNPAGIVRILSNVPGSGPGIALPGGAKLNLAQRVKVGQQVRLNVPVVQLYAPELKQALGDSISGLAGTAMLDGARFKIDLNRNRACFEDGSFAVPGGFGLTLVKRDGALFIESVLPGGPAQTAGLRQGQTIQRWVGGSTAFTLAELWSRVQGVNEIELVVGEEEHVVRLRRAYFVPPLKN